MDFVSWDDDTPNMNGKVIIHSMVPVTSNQDTMKNQPTSTNQVSIVMFQTTNQMMINGD